MLIIQLNRILLPVKHNAYNQCENVCSDFIHYTITKDIINQQEVWKT